MAFAESMSGNVVVTLLKLNSFIRILSDAGLD
jgi:hypothetical protein